MNLQMLQDIINHGSPPLIYFKLNTTIGKKLDKNKYSFKVNIKTQLGDVHIKMVFIHITIINTRSSEFLLKFLRFLNKILKDHNLNTGPKLYAMIKNLLAGEALQFFEQKARENGNKIIIEYELVMQVLTTHFFPTKALQYQKRYLRRVFFKIHNSKILEFILIFKNIIDYLKQLPTFGTSKGFPDN